MNQVDKLYQDLDLVLQYLNNEESGYSLSPEEIFESIKIGKTSLHNYYLCDKLYKDGFVNIDFPYTNNKDSISTITKKDYDFDSPRYLINYQGKEFFFNGGYKNKRKIELRNKYWIIFKTIAAAVNAIMIISISILGLIMASENKELKEELVEKNEMIEELKKASS